MLEKTNPCTVTEKEITGALVARMFLNDSVGESVVQKDILVALTFDKGMKSLRPEGREVLDEIVEYDEIPLQNEVAGGSVSLVDGTSREDVTEILEVMGVKDSLYWVE